MTCRISLFTECLLASPLPEAIARVPEIGVDAVELACRAPHLDIATARAGIAPLVQSCRRHRLEVSALSLYSSFTDAATWEQQVEEACTYIRLAPAFGTRIVKVTPGRPGSRDAGAEHWTLLTRAMRRLAPLAEELDLQLAFETHMRQLTDTIAGSLRLLELAESERIGLTVDFSNLSFAGEKMPDVFAALGSRMFNTHIKNGVLDARGEWWFLPLDTGWTDYAQVFELLRASGYDGYLTLECLQRDAMQNPVENARRDLAILRQYLQA
jgi:sugar phosphate isomerase/epimerase